MNKKRTLLLLITLIHSLLVFSQSRFRDGYIITLESDTLKGQLEVRDNDKNYQSCLFKSGKGIREYFPDQIQGFAYKNGKFFSSKIIGGTFVEVLVTGELDLYKYADNYYMKKAHYFFALNTSRTLTVIENVEGYQQDHTWRGIISFLIVDCLPDPLGIVTKLVLEDKSLVNLTIRYHQCKGSDYVVYNKKPWTEIHAGPGIGLVTSTIQIERRPGEYTYLASKYSSVDLNTGLSVSLVLPRITERVMVQGGIYFSNPSYFSLVETHETDTEYHETYLRFITVSLPLFLRYNIPIQQSGLFIGGGFNYNYLLSAKARLLTENLVGKTVYTEAEAEAFDVNKSQVGFGGEVGLMIAAGRFDGACSVKVVHMPKLNTPRDYYLTTTQDCISLNFSVFLR